MLRRLRDRNEWKLFAVRPKADRPLAIAWWAVLLLRGVLPMVFAVAVGTVVGAVQHGRGLAAPLAAAGLSFILLQVLAPIHQAASANLGSRVAAWLYDRLTEACIRPPGMGHLEDPKLTSDLTVARDFDLGMTGPPMHIAVFGSLALEAAGGRLDLARLVIFAQAAVGTSLIAFGGLNWALDGAAAPVAAVLRLESAMASAEALAQPTGPRRDATARPAREVRFRSVRFSYPNNETPVLEGFELTIPAGSSLAIVGQNGSGKTTLAKLLCRLHDPQQGAIEVDGVDLREIDVAAWRSRVAAVFQDFIRFELPLRENVAPAGAPDEVALARALCAVHLGAGLVLLDEPTAQLDVRGEAEIFDRILSATRRVTTILISHRFSTVRHADRICVLEHGRVIELGTHDELMAARGRYRTMFELQAKRFAAREDEEGRAYGVLA